jgi:hypothetical protein
MAPRARFELATLRLTAECSTVELPGNRQAGIQFTLVRGRTPPLLYPAHKATSDTEIVTVVPEKPTLKCGAHDYSSSRRLTYAPQAQNTLGQDFFSGSM